MKPLLIIALIFTGTVLFADNGNIPRPRPPEPDNVQVDSLEKSEGNVDEARITNTPIEQPEVKTDPW